MTSIANCCLDQITKPVQVFDLGSDAEDPATTSCQKHEFFTLENLSAHFQSTETHTYSCRLMLVFQSLASSMANLNQINLSGKLMATTADNKANA